MEQQIMGYLGCGVCLADRMRRSTFFALRIEVFQ